MAQEQHEDELGYVENDLSCFTRSQIQRLLSKLEDKVTELGDLHDDESLDGSAEPDPESDLLVGDIRDLSNLLFEIMSGIRAAEEGRRLLRPARRATVLQLVPGNRG